MLLPTHSEHDEVVCSTVGHWGPLPPSFLGVPPPHHHQVPLWVADNVTLHLTSRHPLHIQKWQLGDRVMTLWGGESAVKCSSPGTCQKLASSRLTMAFWASILSTMITLTILCTWYTRHVNAALFPVCLSVCLLFVCLFVCLFVYLFIYLFIYLELFTSSLTPSPD